MDPKIAKKTQDTLGKIIKKPPLTDKLLGKPPFRFLHDIMTSVIKTTGFMKGLFTDAEMNSENVKDKDSKIAFLQKSIDFTCMVTGKSISAKPSKIVAGHEPERTNEFLVALASAINSKADNDECIKKFFNKGKDSKDDREDRKKDRSDEKRRKDREEKSDRGKSADRHRGKSRDRDQEDNDEKKDREEKKEREKSRDRDREERHRDRDRERRKKAAENDDIADFLNDDVSDDASDSECDDIFEGLSESDFNDPRVGSYLRERKEQIKQKHSEDTSVNYASYVGTSSIDDGAPQETSRSIRGNRPGAARPRPNRRVDMESKENTDEQTQKEKMDDDIEIEKTQSLKKRKSGTKSRMSNRNPEHNKAETPSGKTSEKMSPVKSMSPKKSTKTEPNKTMTKQKVKGQPNVHPESTPDVKKRRNSKAGSHGKTVKHKSLSKQQSPGIKKSSKTTIKEVKPMESESQRRLSNFDMMQQDPITKQQTSPNENEGSQTSVTISVEKTDTKRSDKHRDEDAGKENETPADMMNGETEKSEPDPPPRMARPTSAKGSRRRREGRAPQGHTSDEDDETRTVRPSDQAIGEGDLPPQVAAARGSARPSSARPAPPKRKQEIVENEPAMRLGSGKPTNVIVDDGKGSDDEDEDETFVVEESAPQPTENEQTVIKPEEEEDGDHGGLVKKMLESKKELEGGSQQKSQVTKKTEIERPTLTDAQRRKQREQIQKEIDKLRGSIQTLTRSANPLGKIMDYVQEDLDSMQKELHKWKAENKEHALALKREKSVTDKAVEPLKAQLSEVDQAIKDQLDLIAAVKSNIIRNDNKIEKMLTTIAKS